MEFVVGIVSSIVTTVAEYTLVPMKNHVKYLSNHAKNIKTLKDRAETMKDAKNRVQHSVDAAKRNGEEIEHDVDKWLSAVDKKIHEDVEKVIQDEENAKKKCFIGLCPNPWTRYKHSLKAEEEMKAVAELLEQGKFDRVSYRSAPQGFTSVKGFEEFESRTLVLNGIMEALKDDGISVIGVQGMGGIGKTTLVKEVARQVEGKLFDKVVIATVTQTLDVEKIQNQIADLLGLKFEEQSMVGKALRLRERLVKEKKVLVILDDIWAKLDIEEIGIPLGDEHKGCKLLLTSRERNVLSNGMDTQKNFEVGFLNEKEAWDLFKKMAGDCVESTDLQPTATEVAKECAGLPIAISAVARALRNKSLSAWKNALRELRRPSPSNFKGITAVYSAIEWSYNYLESEEVKLTFLLCNLIGHNGLVEDLVRYTVGLGLFGGVNTVEEARDKVVTVVADLKASCLLLDSYNEERFDIHDVVWDTALNIAARDNYMLVLRDHEPKEWFDKEKMKDWSVISLCSPHIIAELPKEIECSGLSLFHMAHYGSVEFPPDFFGRTQSLKVVDLFGMQLPSLPVSINHLAGLHTLCLKGCALADITVLGKLQNLEILNLAESDIKALPQEIAQLTRLKLLDLSRCTKLKIIPPNVLSSLSKLEELYMERSFAEWEDEVAGKERGNASLDELNNLPHLTTLCVRIPNAQMIPKNRFIETLDKYTISIGDYHAAGPLRKYACSRILTFQLYTSMYMDNGVKMLLKKADDLYLQGLVGIKNVLEELNDGEDFPHLKKLHVSNGTQVQYITTKKIEFSKLRCLRLEDLPQLISFCSQDERCSTSPSDPLPLFNKQLLFPRLEILSLTSIYSKRIWHNHTYSWFYNLTTLIIRHCGNLEHLLSPSIASCLVQLQELRIMDCKCLREIITTEEIEEERKNVICFPRLNYLSMIDLQNLIIFCSGNHIHIEFPLLKRLWIRNCPKLKGFVSQISNQWSMHGLFNEKVAVPSLETIQLQSCGSVEQIFEYVRNKDPQEILIFQNLLEVDVWGCDSLKNVFPLTIAKDLPKFVRLRINDCGVEEIVSVEEGMEQPARLNFPQVSYLELTKLKKLKCFYEGQHTIVWPMLKKLSTDCSTLLKIVALEQLSIQETNENVQRESTIGQSVFLVEEVGYNGLYHLKFSDTFPELMEIWNGRNTDEYLGFRNLLEMEFCDCSSLKYIFTPSVLLSLKQLRQIQVKECSSVEEVIKGEEARTDKLTFPNLLSIIIESCSNLTNFYLGNRALEFPKLVTIKIADCPNMTAFSPSITRENGEERSGDASEKGVGQQNMQDKTAISFFSDKFVFPSLERLHLSSIKAKRIWQSQTYSWLSNLTSLIIKSCENLEHLLSPSIVRNMVQLQHLKIEDSKLLREIITPEETKEEGERKDVICFPRLNSLHISSLQNLIIFSTENYNIELPLLKELTVKGCPNLKGFVSQATTEENDQPGIQALFNEKFVFPSLERLHLSSIKARRIWHNQTYSWLSNLTSLIIKSCEYLEHLLSPSIARNMVQLQRLKIEDCKLLREIITPGETEDEEEERNDVICFPRLNSLHISGLQNLIIFSRENYNMELPLLKKLTVNGCPKLIGFFSQATTEESDQPGIQALFNEKVTVPSLERMTISKLRNVKMIFHNEYLVPSSFCKLEEMVVEYCDELSTIFPSTAVGIFHCLEKLKVNNCDSLEQIFEFRRLNFDETQAIDSQLRELSILKLPKLKHVWNKDPQGTVTFQNLRKVDVEGCGSLKNVFPVSIAKDLPKLEDLTIFKCGVEEIVSVGEVLEEPVMFNFPQVSSLELTDLKKIKCFYQGQHSIGLPMLKKWGTDCSTLLKMVASEHLSIQQSNFLGMQESATEQPVFLVEEISQVIPKLEELRLQNIGDMDQFPPDLLHQIKVLALTGSHAGSSIFPFLRRFSNLESIVFSSYDFKDEVPCKGESATPTRIRKLELKSSKNLKHTWKKDSELGHILSNIETLRVSWGDHLINVGALSLCFQNLTTLEVLYCKMMTNLFTPSVVQNLVQLTTVRVVQCIAMAEIVADVGDGVTHHQTINFGKLKCLELKTLKSLTSFCSGSYGFNFPCLEELVARGCPRLKFFCQGVLSTPQLRTVEGHWTGDLNTTIQLLYTEKVGFKGLNGLRFSDTSPDLMETWNMRNLQDFLVFKSIKRIEFYNCSSLKYIFTPSLLLSLEQLCQIEVKECSSVEEVIKEGEEAMPQKLTFPKLCSIKIESCSNLTKFYLGNRALEFPSLETIEIADCPKMTSFRASISRENREERSGDASEKEVGDQGDVQDNTAAFFSDQVVCSKLEKLNLLHVEELKYLTVKGCHNLKYLLPSYMVNGFVQLKRLRIWDCKMMEQVIVMEGLTEEERKNQMLYLFPKLELLSLKDLPKLTSFSFENYFEFPCLKYLRLRTCPLLKTFISKSVSGDEPEIDQHIQGTNLEVHDSALFNRKMIFPSLEKLTITGMSECTKIWPDTLDSFCKLTDIEVEGCEKLLNIFPFNMLERLEELEKLQIHSCDSLEEIIEAQPPIANESNAVTASQCIAAETVTTKFAFPKLAYLGFDKLPKLRSLYSRMHTAEWPSLKQMVMIECPKVRMFAPECSLSGQTSNENQGEISNRQPLFWVNEDTFPILEELTLKQNDMMSGICNGQLSLECFRELKVLNLQGFPETSTTLPYRFIQSLPKLQKLAINDASTFQIVQSEGLGDEEVHTLALTQIKELRLSELPELTLKTLEPSLLSFKNLTTLEVSRCNGFICLMACSTAKSLTLLERMSITECEMLEEIIACEGIEIQGDIVFPKLKYLQLSCLPSLASFSLVDHMLEFPVLETVIVRKCKKMRNFCQGDLSTPNLQQMHLTRDEEDELWWEGNLNVTIKHMFDQTNAQISDGTEVTQQLPELE